MEITLFEKKVKEKHKGLFYFKWQKVLQI